MNALDARRLLREAQRATDRARAALRIGARAAEPLFVYALLDAVYDPKPRVRHAAVSVLRHATIPEAHALLARVALEDPIWWVRRAAVAALPPARAGAIVLALDDPFWRVRWAAVNALAGVAAPDAVLRERVLVAAERLGSERARSAAELLRRRLGLAPRALEAHEPPASPAVLDPDPAVTTARVEAGEPFSPAVLVDCLGDPHLPLRRCAIGRLAETALDATTLDLALLWLEEPRIPHAAAAVFELFERVGDRTHADAVQRATERGGPGAVAWALSTATVPRAAALRFAAHPDPRVRRAAAAALDAPPPALLEDSDEDVVRITAAALLTSDPGALRPLANDYAGKPRLLRRVLATAATQQGWEDVVDTAARDPDASIAATAIAWSFARGRLDPEALAAYQNHADPDIRSAVFEASCARSVAEHDDDLGMLRRALAVRPDPALGRAAAESRHAEIRRAATRHIDDPELLVQLCGDRDRTVRAAAFAALPRVAPVAAVLPSLVAQAEARPAARPALERPAPRAVTQRSLGASGVALAPLVVSGVGGLAIGDYARAFAAGCTHFFWEPRYRKLGLFLRREPRAGVVTGSYDADPRAIRAGVERALRRLRRARLDVVLLFWTRSERRLEGVAVLERLRAEGKVRAIGVSTHDRSLALRALELPIDAVMIRHSAMHPGAEASVLPAARAKNAGVLTFSALSYGRVLRQGITAPEAYRFSLFAGGVSGCVSAPYSRRELDENLALLESAPLAPERREELLRIGRELHAESTDFGRLVRRFPMVPGDEPAREEFDPWNVQPLGAD